MKTRQVSIFKVAATYIGTVVGAGFASGQEVLQFFTAFGSKGIWGLILTTVLFILFGYLIMNMGNRLQSYSHIEIIQNAGGKYLGKIFDLIITFFLFGTYAAMIAGTGALFWQQFHLSGMIGCLMMAVLTAGTVLTGINGIINAISFVVPFLLVSVFGVSLYSIIHSPPVLASMPLGVCKNGIIGNWLMASFLYTAYNIILSIAVLGPLGCSAGNKKTILIGAVLGGSGIGLGALMINLALSCNISSILTVPIPMVYLAGNISKSMQAVYSAVLIAEVYTTAVGSLFGFVSRMNNKRKWSESTWIVFGTTLLAVLTSQLGFTNLVKYFYPVVGYGGLVFLVFFIYSCIKNRKIIKKNS